MTIATVLIANRGEIACRIIATCRRMGIATVAVYSAADRDARHVRLADRAVAIGPAAARDSYLRAGHILDAARASGADAIHPGYGFLSENPDFAAACASAGVVFIGPPAEAIRAMGLKAAAKERMAAAGVPVLAGYNERAQDEASLVAAAARIAYPVLVKPSAGGGGKGMHIAGDEAALRAVLARARREAKSAFGDDALILERFLASPRHVEVQVFADTHGEAVHLFERDCSLQRRYQKVIEEAPAPDLDAGLRARIGAAAVAAARAIGYVGAGTVEFLLDRDGFYFMEMNTRLQVEHPATEMITGLDLVEWQIRIARGERLPRTQAEIGHAGHAIEARLYAEDPARDFAPSSGRLARLRFPAAAADLRVDAGVEEGDAIPVHYDPLIAKIIAHGPDRGAALARLRRALAEVSVAGPDTNLAFLRAVLDDRAVRAGPVDTRFLDREHARLASAPAPATATALAIAALDRLGTMEAAARAEGSPPWARWDGWRLNGPAEVVLDIALGETVHRVVATATAGASRLAIGGRTIEARLVARAAGEIVAVLDGTRMRAAATAIGDTVVVEIDGRSVRLRILDPLAAAAAAGAAGGGRLVAEVPGVVTAVLVAAGTAVKRGTALLVLEAMKVEHTIVAPADGTVEAVRFAVGDQVSEGVELVAFAPAG